MVKEYELKAVSRTERAKKLRFEKKIPAVIYGSGFDNISITVDELVFNKLFEEAGESSLINLKIDDKNSEKVLVHEIQKDPVTLNITHIDFYKVNMKEKIRTAIQLEIVGESPAVTDLEGSMVTNKDSVEVECLPGDLVSEIKIDISVLKTFDDVIKISDITIPDGIEVLDDLEEVAILVQPPRTDEEMAELEEEVKEDVDAVEVEGEKKDDEEDGESEDGEKGETKEGTVEDRAEDSDKGKE